MVGRYSCSPLFYLIQIVTVSVLKIKIKNHSLLYFSSLAHWKKFAHESDAHAIGSKTSKKAWEGLENVPKIQDKKTANIRIVSQMALDSKLDQS
jgi:hypothetical protein